MNGLLIKVVPSIGGFRYILNECMRDSFASELELDTCVNSYDAGECELWTVTGVGFIVVSLHDDKSSRYLDVNYAAGRGLYHAENMAALYAMADGYRSDWITCSTLKPGNVRLLKRVGFVVEKVERGRTFLIKVLDHGKQEQKQYGKFNQHHHDDDESKCDCGSRCNKCNRWRRVSRRYRFDRIYRFTGGAVVQ